MRQVETKDAVDLYKNFEDDWFVIALQSSLAECDLTKEDKSVVNKREMLEFLIDQKRQEYATRDSKIHSSHIVEENSSFDHEEEL